MTEKNKTNDFTEGQHTHFYGDVHTVTIHNTTHNHYQGERDNTEGETTGFRDLHLHGNGHTITIAGPTTGGQDMKIDLDKKPIPQLEATKTILVPCPSELCYGYIVEGLQRDVGQVFGIQPHLDKPLREIML